MYVFIYGLKARRSPEETSNKKKYLENWRDVSMLRFLYAFLETGPQVTIQLYILLTFKLDLPDAIITQKHAITIIKIIASVASLSVSMVAYNDDLRATQGEGLSIIGWFFQILYRNLIIASRILIIVLFTTEFKLVVLPVLFCHWMLMIYWVKKDETKFFTKKDGRYNGCFEILFKILMGFIYIFCYITTKDGSTVISQIIYYLLLYLENISMMIAWTMLNDRNLDSFEITAVCVVFLAMILGIVFMLIYYKHFHPSIKRNNKENVAYDCTDSVAITAGKEFFRRRNNEFEEKYVKYSPVD